MAFGRGNLYNMEHGGRKVRKEGESGRKQRICKVKNEQTGYADHLTFPLCRFGMPDPEKNRKTGQAYALYEECETTAGKQQFAVK